MENMIGSKVKVNSVIQNCPFNCGEYVEIISILENGFYCKNANDDEYTLKHDQFEEIDPEKLKEGQSVIGKNIKIVADYTDHNLPKGTITKILEIDKRYDNDFRIYKVKVDGDIKFLKVDEFEVIEEQQTNKTISRRDYFAAAALQGLLTRKDIKEISTLDVVRSSIAWADLIIIELDKE